MPSYQDLRQAVLRTGLWNNGREQGSHGFLLSPDVYVLQPDDAAVLAELARAVDACLLGISRLMAIAADSNLCGNHPSYRWFKRTLGRGSLYGVADALKPGNLPILRKVDIVPGADDKLWVAEIDATNPRSWGYSLVGRALAAVAQPGATMLPGVVPFIVEYLRRRKVTELVFLYGHTQRFYAPEFAIVANALVVHGITMHVLDETQVGIVDGQAVISETGHRLPRTFVDFPPMNQNKPLIDWLAAATRARTVDFLVPPKHFLASKALLAVLSNAVSDQMVEHMLLTQIEPHHLATVRHHLPPTWLVDDTLPAELPARAILKKAVSSGMKGIVFGDEPDFANALAAARTTPGNYVVQQMVEPASFPFTLADDPQPGQWYLRLTAYMSARNVEDIAVTARTTPRVHGSRDAIVTGTVVA